MFTADTIIDSIQTAKKEAVKTFVKNEDIAKSLTAYVDAETALVKQTAKATTEAAATFASETTKAIENIAKFDYTKFTENLTDSFKTTSKK
jgi:hypothetical protein